jgi:ketosteroid isomerase-like protein
MKSWMMLALAVYAGCLAAGQSPHTPHTANDMPKSDGVFASLRGKWVSNLHDKEIDASVAQYEADGEFVNPDGSSVRGTAALHRFFEMITSTYDSSLQFHSQRAEVSDTLAYDSGTYFESLTLRASGKAQHSSGSYLTIYRQGKDGAWLIAEQMWTGTIGDGAGDVSMLELHPVVEVTFGDLAAAGVLPAGRNRTEILGDGTSEVTARQPEGTHGGGRSLRWEQIQGAGDLKRGASWLVVAGVDG